MGGASGVDESRVDKPIEHLGDGAYRLRAWTRASQRTRRVKFAFTLGALLALAVCALTAHADGVVGVVIHPSLEVSDE